MHLGWRHNERLKYLSNARSDSHQQSSFLSFSVIHPEKQAHRSPDWLQGLEKAISLLCISPRSRAQAGKPQPAQAAAGPAGSPKQRAAPATSVSPASLGPKEAAVFLTASFSLVFRAPEKCKVVFETESHCGVQAGLDFAMYHRLTSNSQQSFRLSLPRAGITGMGHHAQQRQVSFHQELEFQK